MNWECRLYGHHWRHPGEFEVVIVGGSPPAHPFECARCGDEQFVDVSPADRLDPSTQRTAVGDQGGQQPIDPEEGTELSSSR